MTHHDLRHSRLFTPVGICALAMALCGCRSAQKAGALEKVIAQIEAGRAATPIIGEATIGGDATVTFLAEADGNRVPRIVSDVTGWGEHIDGTFDFTVGTMIRVGETKWYSLQTKVAPGARIEYLVAYGQDYRLDPHNPRKANRPTPASEFVTAGYRPPQEFVDPPVSPSGLVTETVVSSHVLRRSCRALVYTPPGYCPGDAYPLAVFLDMRSAPVSRVLDWLIARHTIQPIVVVFIETKPSGAEHPTPVPLLRTFLTDELPEWMASRYGVMRSPAERAIIGISYGAKDALDAALSPTRSFDNLGLLIPGRRIEPADVGTIAKRSNHHLRVVIVAGRYDQANVATARRLRDALVAAGHAVDYSEVPEGHSSVTWINHVRAVLVSLFGRQARRP